MYYTYIHFPVTPAPTSLPHKATNRTSERKGAPR